MLVSAVDKFGPPGIALYIVCMFVYPWWDGAWSWEYVQRVWDRWQTLNAGLLAFLASIVALRVTRSADLRAEDRNRRASTAMLPAAFSELQEYLRSCGSVYAAAWHGARPMQDSMPPSPKQSKEIFRDCIQFAESKVGNYLANILVELQVHEARFAGLLGRNAGAVMSHLTLMPYIAAVGMMHARIDKQFEFARDEAAFDPAPLVWEDLRQSFRIIGIEIDEIVVSRDLTLERHTRKLLAKR